MLGVSAVGCLTGRAGAIIAPLLPSPTPRPRKSVAEKLLAGVGKEECDSQKMFSDPEKIFSNSQKMFSDSEKVF